MTCVVCGAAITGEPCFASSYERIRGIYACCSAACSARFDPDRHWIPAAQPKPLDDGELARLSRVLRERLANGDRPVVVVREMLVAGLPPQRVRLALADDHRPRAAPYKLLGHRIETAVAHPWVVGYRRHPFMRDFWKYIDIDTDRLHQDLA